MLGYIEKAWEICNRFIIMVIQWAWEYIFNSTFKQTGLNFFFFLSLEFFCFGAGRTRNKLFSIMHYFLEPWTGVWSVLSSVKSHFSGFGAILESNHCVPLLTAILFPAESYSGGVWTLHAILSSCGLCFHSLLLNIISVFPCALVGYRWGSKFEMSLDILWFGISDHC